jgi:signal-transduction protein with cAMP-binding, CBS, and nucleotidyltransferase domain
MDAQFLRNVSLFQSLSLEELEPLAQMTITRTFNKDSVIILAEEEGDALFIN